MIHFDCTQLEGRARDICEGTSGLPETGPGNTRESYIKLWQTGVGLAPQPVSTKCVYRGEEIDRMQCPSCIPEKKVEIKVFRCDLFNRCVLAPGTSERFCGNCESRLESAAEVG